MPITLKCQNCAGNMRFDANIGKVVCESCGSVMDVPAETMGADGVFAGEADKANAAKEASAPNVPVSEYSAAAYKARRENKKNSTGGSKSSTSDSDIKLTEARKKELHQKRVDTAIRLAGDRVLTPDELLALGVDPHSAEARRIIKQQTDNGAVARIAKPTELITERKDFMSDGIRNNGTWKTAVSVWNEVEVSSDSTPEIGTMSAVQHICSSCGAVIMTDENTTTEFCLYCGSQNFISERLSDHFKPQGIIPFKYGREEAIVKFFKWCKGGRFTPFDFCSNDNIEKITGLYVPYWTFNYDVMTEVEGEGIRVTKKVDGSTKYIYRDISDIYEKHQYTLKNIPFDASRKLDDDLMDAIEPFNLKEVVPFDEKYLLGYYSDKYDVESSVLKHKAKSMVDKFILERFVKNAGFDEVNVTHKQVEVLSSESYYILLPTYILNYRYQGQTYTFLMNGQTGEVTGHYPVSRLKKLLFCVCCFILIALAVKLIASILLGGFFG